MPLFTLTKISNAIIKFVPMTIYTVYLFNLFTLLADSISDLGLKMGYLSGSHLLH